MDARWYCHPAARRWQCARPSAAALAFHAELPGYQRTPLVEQPALASELSVGRVLVKDESARLGLPAFKMLGASWAIARLLAGRSGLTGTPTLAQLRQAAASRGLRMVTATDGNHGRAVARMASMLGLDTCVVVPRVVPGPAVAAIAAEGATVLRVAGDYDAAVRHAAAYASARPGAELIQDMSWPGYQDIPGWIAEGYATMLHEIDAGLPAFGMAAPSLIVVPAGVGSLAQAVVAHYRSGPPATAVITVEPDSAACVLASLLAGGLRSVPTGATIMTGLNCGTPSAAAWPYPLAGLDRRCCVR